MPLGVRVRVNFRFIPKIYRTFTLTLEPETYLLLQFTCNEFNIFPNFFQSQNTTLSHPLRHYVLWAKMLGLIGATLLPLHFFQRKNSKKLLQILFSSSKYDPFPAI
jgi:hypothetical protein